MNNLRLFYLAHILRSPIFWFPTIVDYFLWRGLDLSTVFFMITIYSISIVIFEFPTGVIGDRYSHKTSIILGSLITCCGLLILSLPLPHFILGASLIIGGFGNSLVSGSDIALLHTISLNFDKDYKTNRILGLGTMIVGIMLGGIMYSFYRPLPLVITSVCFGLAAFLTLLIKPVTNNAEISSINQGNIFAQAFSALKFLRSHRPIQYILILIGGCGGFFLTYKWYYNPLFEIWALPLSWYGIVSAVSILMIMIGTWLAKKYTITKNALYIGILTSIFIVNLAPVAWFSMFAFMMTHLLWGSLEGELGVELNNEIKDDNRAAINSLSSLLSRLSSGLSLSIAGAITGLVSVQINNLLITLFFVLVMGSCALYIYLTGTKHGTPSITTN